MKRTALPLALLALACACIALQYRAGVPVQQSWFNADGMYLPVLFADLFEHGGTIKDWYLTPAPYFFPDYAIYAAAYAASRGPFNQFLVFGLLQLAAATATIAWIERSCIREHAMTAAVLVAIAFGWMAMRGVEPYIYMLASGYHFGGFVAGLAFVALWLQCGGALRRWRLAGMCALAFLTTLSDMMFMVHTVLPFLATSALARRRGGPFRPGAMRPHGAILCAALLGAVSYRLVVSHRTRYSGKIGLDHVWANTHALWDTFGRILHQQPLLGLVVGAWLVCALAALVRIVQGRSFLELPRPLLLVLAFSLVASGGNLASMILVTNIEVNTRYMIAALSWPVIVAVMLLAHWRAAWFNVASLAASAVLVVLLGADALAARRGDGASAPYPAQIACIDRALAAGDARNGIAGYWDAKRIQALSQRRLVIAQYIHDLTEHRWITSAAYFRRTYDFAIVSAANGPEYLLPMDQLIARNGPPPHTTVCGTDTVLVYAHDQLAMPGLPGG